MAKVSHLFCIEADFGNQFLVADQRRVAKILNSEDRIFFEFQVEGTESDTVQKRLAKFI